MNLKEKQLEIFQASMVAAAKINHHILQNIPLKVYEDALYLFSNQNNEQILNQYVRKRCYEEDIPVPPSCQ